MNKVQRVFELSNKPEHVESCVMVIYRDDMVLLDWNGFKSGGESGFFLSVRACKMYVTQHITNIKSEWKFNKELTEIYNQ